MMMMGSEVEGCCLWSLEGVYKECTYDRRRLIRIARNTGREDMTKSEVVTDPENVRF